MTIQITKMIEGRPHVSTGVVADRESASQLAESLFEGAPEASELQETYFGNGKYVAAIYQITVGEDNRRRSRAIITLQTIPTL
jgi:hypothetical protein